MRIFIAIPISSNLQSVIRVWQKEHSQLMVRWVKGKNLHITLIPPREETDIKSLKDRLSQLRGRFKPFEIELREITFGPHQNKRKLIWAQGPATKQIIELRDTIE